MNRSVLHLFFTFALGAIGLSSCVSEPEFSVEPNISFSGVEQYTLRNPQNALYDSLVLVVHFEDGDGDLGLSSTDPADASGPYASGQKFHNNFFSTLYKKTNGRYQPILVNNTPINYNGRFQRISSGDRNEPLEGEIRYSLTIFSSPPLLKTGDTVRFDIQIADRALHESQVVTSSDIIMFSK